MVAHSFSILIPSFLMYEPFPGQVQRDMQLKVSIYLLAKYIAFWLKLWRFVKFNTLGIAILPELWFHRWESKMIHEKCGVSVEERKHKFVPSPPRSIQILQSHKHIIIANNGKAHVPPCIKNFNTNTTFFVILFHRCPIFAKYIFTWQIL